MSKRLYVVTLPAAQFLVEADRRNSATYRAVRTLAPMAAVQLCTPKQELQMRANGHAVVGRHV